AQYAEARGDHLLRRRDQGEARIAYDLLVNDERVGVVIRVKIVREVAQVVHQVVRCAIRGGELDDLRVPAHRTHERFLVRLRERAELAQAHVAVPGEAAFLELAKHA